MATGGALGARREGGSGTLSLILASIQGCQILAGLAGQAFLLLRWSPNSETDLFLLLSSVPWFVSAGFLLGGLESLFPASYHQALLREGKTGSARFLSQVTAFTIWLSLAAGAVASGLVFVLAMSRGLDLPVALWMGAGLGGQIVPATLAGLGRGVLLARDRLITMRLALLSASILTALGYGLLPGSPGLALPLVAMVSALGSAALAWIFIRQGSSPLGRLAIRPLQPELRGFVSGLIALSAAAGLVHLQTLAERWLVLSFWAEGSVTAFSVAGRGWEAVLTLVSVAWVLPFYPRWSANKARGRFEESGRLLRHSLARVSLASLLFGLVAAPILWFITSWPAATEFSAVGVLSAHMALVLIPRFLLLTSIQPLVLKQYAQGTAWRPVPGALLGIGVILLGGLTIVKSWGLAGLSLTTALSVIPGWFFLVWWERRG